ncbi:MAG: CHAT domain-containing protein, partial [Chloroflexi bacterium]
MRNLREGIGRSIQADPVRAFNPADITRPQEFGERLFRALFHSRALELYRTLRDQLEASSSPDRRLIIKINPATYELASLPWELLRDPDNGFLAFDRRTPLIRFIPGRPPHKKTYEPEWRILLVASNPPGTPRLDLLSEMRNIQQAFEEVAPQIKLTIEYLHAPSTKKLRTKLRDFNPHVFHFMGHGGAGHLLVDAPGQSVKAISEANLAATLQNIPALRMVFLNACETAAASEENLGLAYALSRAGIPAVVANQFPARDDAAKEMADEFYRVLAGGLPVDEAVLWGRIAVQGMRDNPTLEWATPVLYLQNPDGFLFDDLLQRQRTAKSPAKTVSVPPLVASTPVEPRPVESPRPAKPPSSEMAGINTERIQSLREQLRIYHRNLDRLQVKKAKYGLDVPTHVANEIEEMQKAIAQIEEELAALGQKSGQEIPVTLPPPPYTGPTHTTGTIQPDPRLRELYRQAKEHIEQQEWEKAIPL